MKLALVAVFFVVVFVLGCGEATHDPGSNNGPGGFRKLEGNFQSVFTNIIQPKCVRCHSGSDAPHKIYLTSYEEIVGGTVFPPLIVPGKPNDSSLYKSVLSGKMPKNRPRLSDAELGVLYNWILDGALKEPGDEPPCDDDEPPDDDGNGCDKPCDDDEPCD